MNPSDFHFKGWLFAVGFKYYTCKMEIPMNIHEMCIKAGRHSSCKSHEMYMEVISQVDVEYQKSKSGVLCLSLGGMF